MESGEEGWGRGRTSERILKKKKKSFPSKARPERGSIRKKSSKFESHNRGRCILREWTSARFVRTSVRKKEIDPRVKSVKGDMRGVPSLSFGSLKKGSVIDP